MQLSKALQVQLDYNGILNGIHIDEDGYFNLTDMCEFFPGKRVQHWKENQSTKEFVKVVENMLNPQFEEDLINRISGLKFIPALRTKRGRHHGGVYAHKYVAMEFAMWLSPEFKLEVIQAYENGVERKEAWDIQRIMAANGYKFLTESVKENIVPEFEKGGKNPYYAYTEEADLLNVVVFGRSALDAGRENQRDTATPLELQLVEYLQRIDSGLIEAGLNYEQRKEKLSELCDRKRLQLISPTTKLIKS